MLAPKNYSKPDKTPTAEISQPHQAAILRDRVEMLYSASRLSLLISLAVAGIFLGVHTNADKAGFEHYLWLGAMGVVLAIRLGLELMYFRMPALRDSNGWLAAFRFGTLLAAACWGAAGIVFHQPGDETLQVFTILVIAGIAAGALSSLATDYLTYRGYVILCLVPVAGMATWQSGGLQTGVGLLILLLIVFLLRSAHRTSDSILHSLQLRYENADLLEDLEREKRRLINEAETMMGTVLASAPIALWAIDTKGVITFMDGKRLATQTKINLPKIGENLFEHFSQLTTILRTPEGELRAEADIFEVEIEGASFEVHYSPVRDGEDVQTGAIGVAIDISERKAHEQELEQRANFDALTGLANRTLAMDTVDLAFARARRNDTLVGIYFLDLDNFKAINDTLGHQAGDALLCSAALRLQRCLRESDFAARIGGDEFLVIAEGLHKAADAEILAHKLVDIFQAPFDLNGRPLYTTTSIGIATYPRDGGDATELMQCADAAMYHAKDMGKNNYRFFTQEMHKEAIRHMQIETELRLALERKELKLFYQPKIDTRRNAICGAEALLRWDSRALGPVGPDEFVPVAEVAGLMPQIGEWILTSACSEAAGWPAVDGWPVHVAINVSPQQFRKTDLLANVTQALVQAGLPASSLELEITESLLVQDSPDVLNVLNSLNQLGISLALDDFGTGYSSLSYLRKFPLQVLKIDRAFVQDLGEDSDSDSLVDAIITMAGSLRMTTVAEGVESLEQLHFLQTRGVDMVQGYIYSKPLPADQFSTMLATPLSLDNTPAQSKQAANPLARFG